MGEKKQLNVRIPLELQEKIENDGRPKVEIVIEALELYFASKKLKEDSINDISANNPASQNDSNTERKNSNSSQSDSNISNNDSNEIRNDTIISKTEQQDSNEVLRMKTEIDFLRAKIDDLLKLLHQEQVLHIQTQRMLTAPQPAMKKWWQVWK